MSFCHLLLSAFPPRSQPDFKPFYILLRVRCELTYVNSFIKGKIFHYKDFFNSIIDIFTSQDMFFISQHIRIFSIHFHVQFMGVLINNSKSKAQLQYAVRHCVLMQDIFVVSIIYFAKTIRSCIYFEHNYNRKTKLQMRES